MKSKKKIKKNYLGLKVISVFSLLLIIDGMFFPVIISSKLPLFLIVILSAILTFITIGILNLICFQLVNINMREKK